MYKTITEFLSFSGEMNAIVKRGFLTSLCGGIGIFISYLLFNVGLPVTDGLAIVISAFTIIVYFWAQMAMIVRKCEVIWPAAIITLLAIIMVSEFVLRSLQFLSEDVSYISFVTTSIIALLMTFLVSL